MAAVALGAALVAGCTSWEPDQLEILVATTPPGAACVVSRGGQPIATVDPTPAIALVAPGSAQIGVYCRRSGFADANAVLPGRGTGETRIDFALSPLGPQALLPATR